MSASGVRAVSTSFENTQQCPERMRMSSRRFSTRSGDGESVIVARVYGMPASMSSSDQNKLNRLAHETSPYLLQHAHNPVDWYSWGEPAFAAARQSGKPILLSVGYSACHWCHVMAHESFEDEATARVMNDLYVNIKVDREERPDLDKIYQTSHQLMSGQGGGWPLTVFLTPQQVPIFIGTYFPKERRYGMPAFREVLVAVDQYYRGKADEIRERGEHLIHTLANMQTTSGDDFAALSAAPLAAARERLSASYDADDGGFGGGPKFPHSTSLEFLLGNWRHRGGA